MEQEIRMRLKWVRLYEESGHAGLTCLRCGISRPTLRKWWRRYQREGLEGLRSRSRRPKNSPFKKICKDLEQWILELRVQRKLGARRIQNELKRLYCVELALATIHKVLAKKNVKPLLRRRKKTFTRYERPIPGDRVQMDTCKITAGLYQYTAVDDCTRYKVVALYPRRTAQNTLDFLDKVMEETPFPVQRIQTDRGREFFAYKVQDRLMEYGIKFRPIKPFSPHLNGKVERAQKTDLDEFYASIDVDREDLREKLQEWQHFYNWDRAHGGLTGKTPMDRYHELMSKTPLWEDVDRMYEPSREQVRLQNYQADLKLQRLKPCL